MLEKTNAKPKMHRNASPKLPLDDVFSILKIQGVWENGGGHSVFSKKLAKLTIFGIFNVVLSVAGN